MKNTSKEIVFIAKEDDSLLPCVRSELSNLPSGKIKSYLEHRMISVDGFVTSKYDYPVLKGQSIKISLSRNNTVNAPLDIIYEDEVMFAVNKPAGLLSVASDSEKEKTAYRLLKDSGIEPIFVVHRLDKDTSGVLLFAKSPEIRDELQNNWDSTIKREYIAICEGVFSPKKGRRESYLRETSTHLVYSATSGDGKRAITNYEVISENANYSMLRINIETGRKNQIRVHMKELSHPVVGDKKYGAKSNPLKRLGLHASVLEIIHPVTGAAVTIKAPKDRSFRLPKDL